MQTHRDLIRIGVAAVLACLAARAACASGHHVSSSTSAPAALVVNSPSAPAALAVNSLSVPATPGKPAQAANGAVLLPAAGPDPALPVARLNGAPIYGLTLVTMHRMMQQKEPELSRSAMLERLVNNRLLAAQLPTRFRDHDFNGNRRVGFAPAVASEDQLVASLRPLYEASQARADERTLRQWRVTMLTPPASVWDGVFGAPGKMLLDYSLSPAQLAKARQVVLLRSTLPGAETITLHDVAVRLNVQGRVEFFQRNFAFVAQQARQRFANILLLNWAKSRYGARAVADLQAAFAERAQARALMALHGIGSDMHGDSALLDKLAARVGAEEIRAWYGANKSEFSRIVRVRARHIRVADEASAQKVLAQLAKGEDFARLARQVSLAEDARQGGDLGWIEHDAAGSWLTDLAFTQQAGQVSAPFRAPVGPNDAADWEIIKVEQREDGFQPVESESVRYTASRAIAAQKAAQQLAALQQQLRQQARLQIVDDSLKVAMR